MPTEPPEWQNRSDGSVWVIGMILTSEHLDALRGVRYLTLYNTRVQPGLFTELRDLELLDLRTTSVPAVEQVRGLPNLRALSLAHNRQITDLSVLGTLASLELLELYALSKVTALPDMGLLGQLRRVNLGQMIRLADWTTLVGAPVLETLELQNKLQPDLDVLRQLAARETFRHFMWSAPDEPQRSVEAAKSAASRPKPPAYTRLRDLWRTMA